MNLFESSLTITRWGRVQRGSSFYCIKSARETELVVVDSIGRATALSSGTVDAVFWTRTNELSMKKSVSSVEEREAYINKKIAKMSEDELKAFNEIRELIIFEDYGTADMPEGTIFTVPYYSDIVAPVMKKK